MAILRATNIQEDHLLVEDNLVFVPNRYVDPDQLLRSGDIVVCMSSGSKNLVGKAAQLHTDWHGSFGTFCGVVRPTNSIDKEYLGWFFASPEYRDFVRQKASGVNINNLRQSDFSQISVPLAPLPEQRRIVAKIEELFSRLDAGVAALKRVQAALKRYKASVLKAACEGRLVAQDPSDEPADVLLARILAERRAAWEAEVRKKGKDPKKVKYEEPQAPEANALPDLPHGWIRATLGQLLARPLANGRSATDSATGHPILRLTSVKDGRIDLSEVKLGALSDSDAKRFAVRSGDFLVARGNGSIALVGRGGLVESEPWSVAFPDLLIRVNVDSSVLLPRFLRLIWDSPSIRSQIETVARTTAGIHKINQNDLSGFNLPVPPLALQHEIVAEAERQLSGIDKLDKTVNNNLARAQRLRQSILARAFSGKLVPQDPGDEPAAVLLARVRAGSEGTEGRAQAGRRARAKRAA